VRSAWCRGLTRIGAARLSSGSASCAAAGSDSRPWAAGRVEAQSHGTDRVAVAEPGYGAAQYGRSRNSGQTPVPRRPSQSVIDSVGPAGAGFPAEYSAGVRANRELWASRQISSSVLSRRPRSPGGSGGTTGQCWPSGHVVPLPGWRGRHGGPS